MSATGRGAPGWVRLACHAAAELPFVVVAVVGCLAGWRATADDADIGYRAWDVFTARPPLVGSISQASGLGVPLVYHPGPVLSWALALPVRIDHVHGVLWGGALLAAVAAAIAVEAAYRVRGLPAAVAVAAVFVVVVARWPAVVLNPAWDPYAGLPWFVAAMATAWAVAAGRLRWWPVLVGTASVAAEIHQMYAPACVALVVVAPLVGMGMAGGPGRWRQWLPVGLGVGALAWAVPLFQQATGHPGNLSGIITYSRGQPTLGLAFSLRNLAADAGLHPLWLGKPDQSSLFTLFAAIDAQYALAGAAVLAAVVVVGVVAWRAGRRQMAALSVVVLVAAVGTVATVADVVKPRLLTLGYIDLVLWPVGVAVWALVGWAGATSVTWAWRRRRRVDTGGVGGSRRAWPAAAVGAAAVVLAASAWTTVTGARSMTSMAGVTGGRATVGDVEHATRTIEASVPRGPVVIEIGGPWAVAGAVISGTVYALRVDGWNPEVADLSFALGPAADPATTRGVPAALIDVGPDAAEVHIAAPGPA